MLKNILKSLFRNGERSEKVIRNPYRERIITKS